MLKDPVKCPSMEQVEINEFSRYDVPTFRRFGPFSLKGWGLKGIAKHMKRRTQ